MEIRSYNPHKRKIIFLNDCEHFIGYLEKSKGYKFYVPNHSPRIVETGNVRFLELDEISESVGSQDVNIQKAKVDFHAPINISLSTPLPHVVLAITENTSNVIQHKYETHPQMTNSQRAYESEPQEMSLRRSQRERRSTVANDYWFTYKNQILILELIRIHFI